MGFAQCSSPFYILKPRGRRRALPFLHLPLSRKLARRAAVSVGNQRGSCRFPLRLFHEKNSSAKPAGLAEL